MLAAVAIAAVLTLALVLTSFNSSGGQASRLAISAPAANSFEQVAFLEANTLQIPYTAPAVRSFEEVAFIEANTMQIPYAAPLRSQEETALWEANTMQTPYSAPARPYTGLAVEE
jgi:hypothetical protein